MDIIEEMSLTVSESAHEQELLSQSQWRSRVTHKHKPEEEDTNHFVTGRGFQKKYPTLGDTKQVRVPWEVYKEVMEIVSHLERISSTHDVDYTHRILGKMIEGLENVP